MTLQYWFNTSKPELNDPRFAYDDFISFNESISNLIAISLKFVREGPTDDKSALVQIMVLCFTGDKQLP